MGSRLIETGRPRTCNISTKESCPSTEPKLGDWRGAPSRSSCWGTGRSSTTAAPQASSSDAYPSPKVRSYYKKYTRGLVVTTQHLGPSLETHPGRVSTGQPRWPMPLGLYAPAKGVNSTRSRPTCPLGMATGRVRGGCSFSGPEPETRTKNPTRTRTPWWGKIRPRTRTRWGPENRRGPVNRVMQTQIAVQRIQKYKQQSTDCYLSI
jgi:hypothetical protein